MKLKKELYLTCLDLTNERIELAEEGLKQAQYAANNETKSSAGDKYETGRAMMHLEKEKLSSQLSEAIKMKKVLNLINPEKASEIVELGSVVIASNANYYIAISAGVMRVEEKDYFGISPVSPIGQQLMGKKDGDTFSFAGKTQSIERID